MENLPESPFYESTLTSSPSLGNNHPHNLDALTPNQLVLLIHDASLREEVLHQLFKKRDSCYELALLLWYKFNAVYILLLEVISVYWKLTPSMLSMRESARACNVLSLFQVLAENPETRRGLIKAKIPCYFYPFLKHRGNDKPLEYVRVTALGVLGSLTKFDDPYGSFVLHFFLESKVLPLCLECMDLGDKMSRTVATLILMKIMKQEKGMIYCSDTPERFFSIAQVLKRVVEKLSQEPCLLHLAYVVHCYRSVSEIIRLIGPCDAFKKLIPPQLFDNTFRDILRYDYETSWMLQVVHLNVYGCLNIPPIEDKKKIAEKATTSSKAKGKGKGKGKGKK